MVRFRIDPPKGELRVLGHAGCGEKGSDPVCAGVSALVLTLCRRVEELADQDAVRLLALAAEPGAAFIRCVPLPGHGEQAEEAFRVIAAGLRMLAREYPGYVEETGSL